jgi:hypothetical protein
LREFDWTAAYEGERELVLDLFAHEVRLELSNSPFGDWTLSVMVDSVAGPTVRCLFDPTRRIWDREFDYAFEPEWILADDDRSLSPAWAVARYIGASLYRTATPVIDPDPGLETN